MTGAADLVAAVGRDPARAGVFSDFDGTLAPIVDDPPSARPLEGVTDVLAALTARVGFVGVISGRPADFLLRHLRGTGVSMWGLYGLETVEDGRVVAVPDAEPWRDVVEDVAQRAERELGADVEVERKHVTLTIHFRRARDRADEVHAWADQVAASTGLEVHDARMSFELRPSVPHGKGIVLERAVEERGLSTACFFGDDTGDLNAFDALDRLAAGGKETFKVGVDSDEAPATLLDRADFVVEGPEGVVAVLAELAQARG